jgi:hypothetical protein
MLYFFILKNNIFSAQIKKIPSFMLTLILVLFLSFLAIKFMQIAVNHLGIK